MRNLLIAACCAALVGGVSVASAQTTAPAPQDSLKTHSPMDSNAAMKKKHKMKKSMSKSDDTSKGDMSKGGDMSKDNMKKDSK
jgi:pentapeptide MXKDX repeat protein